MPDAFKDEAIAALVSADTETELALFLRAAGVCWLACALPALQLRCLLTAPPRIALPRRLLWRSG